MNELNFDDLTPIEIPVSVGGKKYTLREAGEDAACKYRNKMLDCTELSDGKLVRVRGIADAEPLLVSLCLFDEQNKLVPLQVVRSWPARVVKALHDKAKEISELSEGEETIPTIRKRLEEAEAREASLKNVLTDTQGSLD